MNSQSARLVISVTVFALLMLLVPPPRPAHAAAIVVNSTADTTANDSSCTLREAIINANDNAATWSDCAAGSGADAITFNFNGTIRLSGAQPTITDAAGLVTDGAGQSVSISGDTDGNGTADVPIFTVGAFSSLTVQNLTLTKGNAGSGYGGAIHNNQGTVIVTNSTLSGNQASAGGAVSSQNGAVTVTNSIFSSNSASSAGGAISSGGPLTISNSIFSGNNTSGNSGGGAIFSGSTLEVTNSTLTDNATTGTGWGGGIFNNGGSLTVTNSTFSDNALASNSGIHNNGGAVTLRNTIVADNPPEGNCSGIITNGGNNIDGGTTCSWAFNNGSMSNTNPRLTSLADNGGPTQTIALLPTSPAIDAGNPTVCALSAPNGPGGMDQRGVARKGICDIGAFEFGTKLQLPLVIR